MIVVGSERNFAELRPRLFSGRVSATSTKRVSDAVRRANPHVDLDALRPGTILTVPDVPEVSVQGDLSLDEMSREGVSSLFADAASSLEALVEDAQRRQREDLAEGRRLIKTMDGREVKAASARDETLAEDIEATRRAISEEEKRAKARAAALKQAHAEWSAELEALREILP